MNSRYLSNIALVIAGAFLVVASQAFAVATFEWLMFGIGAIAVLMSATIVLPRGAAQRGLDALIGILGAWTVVASLVFVGSTVIWLGFASGAALVALAVIGLTLHELTTERVVHSFEVTDSNRARVRARRLILPGGPTRRSRPGAGPRASPRVLRVRAGRRFSASIPRVIPRRSTNSADSRAIASVVDARVGGDAARPRLRRSSASDELDAVAGRTSSKRRHERVVVDDVGAALASSSSMIRSAGRLADVPDPALVADPEQRDPRPADRLGDAVQRENARSARRSGKASAG